MSFLINPYIFGGGTLFDSIVASGVPTTNLKLCLDAADSASYAGGSLTTTAGPTTLTTQASAFNNVTFRQVIDASVFSASGTTVIVSFQGDGAGTFTCSKAYIGEKAAAGDAYDFASAPTALTFGGAAGFTVIAAGIISSDPLSFTLDETKSYVISWLCPSSTTDDFGIQTTLSGWAGYSKAGDDTTTVDATGYTVRSNVVGVYSVSVAASGNGGQLWADRSSSATNFVRGTTGIVDASDPTFNGTVGTLDATTYWLLNSDLFVGSSGIVPSWMQPFHKDGATYTMMWGLYHPAAATGDLVSNSLSASRVKVSLSSDPKEIDLVVTNSVGVIATQTSSIILTDNAWNILGVSVSENGGAAGGAFFINGTSETFNPSYAGPDAADNSGVVVLNSMTGNHRLAWCAIWDAALSVAQMQAVFGQTRERFGI